MCVRALTELVLKKSAQLRHGDIFKATGILFEGVIHISRYLKALMLIKRQRYVNLKLQLPCYGSVLNCGPLYISRSAKLNVIISMEVFKRWQLMHGTVQY